MTVDHERSGKGVWLRAILVTLFLARCSPLEFVDELVLLWSLVVRESFVILTERVEGLVRDTVSNDVGGDALAPLLIGRTDNDRCGNVLV